VIYIYIYDGIEACREAWDQRAVKEPPTECLVQTDYLMYFSTVKKPDLLFLFLRIVKTLCFYFYVYWRYVTKFWSASSSTDEKIFCLFISIQKFHKISNFSQNFKILILKKNKNLKFKISKILKTFKIFQISKFSKNFKTFSFHKIS
jgi:hypothetical protein